MVKGIRILGTISVLLLFGCAHLSEAPVPASQEPVLSHAEAIERTARVANIHYTLNLSLDGEKKDFSGSTTIVFDLANTSKDLRLDLYDATLFEVDVNGTLIPLNDNRHFIVLPKKNLRVGKNRVSVKYSRPYANDGKGLHRFIDPVDKKPYLHTQFEPFYANRMFPCFDQPDLKATYTLQVEVPKSWEVITSVRESKKTAAGTDRMVWHFPESATFSTYLLSLHAGPYKKWVKPGKIPLRLFARQSMARYVRPQDWFSITSWGLQFYGNYFNYPYPFSKYDQLLVPEFNSGAMENVAAVTFNENFISRGDYSKNHLANQADVILHEMAHMWFGDLVTMKWWNDLWLNESFATYMASWALAHTKEFKDRAWQDFRNVKGWGYWEDQLPTTHPILASVKNTQEAGANFDGITYAKGAAVLKQLHYFLGDKGFKKGLAAYFKKFQFKNTELKDFIGTLQDASKTDLQFWSPQWLETAGVNSVQAKWTCKKGKLKELQLIQTAERNTPTLRHHRLNVALMSQTKKGLRIQEVPAVLLKGPLTKVNPKGKDCPQAVYPNFQDQAFIRVVFDSDSFDFLSQNINLIRDPLLRQMLWADFGDRVKDQQTDLFTYAHLLLNALSREKNEIILGNMLYTLVSPWAQGDVVSYLSEPSLHQIEEAKTLLEQFSEVVFKRLVSARPSSEIQKTLFSFYVPLARNEKNLSRLEKMLTGKIKLKGFSLDQDKRWQIISHLAAYRFPSSEKWIESELKKDPSYTAKLWALRSRASLMDYPQKTKVIQNQVQEKGSMSLHELRTQWEGMFPSSQKDLRKQYASQFYDDFKQVLKTKSDSEKGAFLILLPSLCEDSAWNQAINFVTENEELLTPRLKKSMKRDLYEGQRCQKIIALAKQHSHK